MRKRYYAALAGLVVAAAGIGVPAAATAGEQQAESERQACQRSFDRAVWEDMDSYNKRDEARYRAIIHQNMVTVGRKGQLIIGYQDNVEPVVDIQFKLPYEWSMPWTVTHTVVEDCKMGFALLDAYYKAPSQNIDRHYTISLTLVREHGKWQVIKDTVTDVLP
ncbi:hypothetical protein [Amycolatopsis regifaucium]|uniref:DUF4440 domain-containing protein n=1 Tax=Amycolatopsis regifaucium TaxID=546365 RepID=A0A154M5D9_9PSEU|nr:hypothetical protein [Amycolatopsis regifaucium]KZB79851.1 hypothetical protein AVL48_15850 [Amycolatopsis regifaucium]OKA09832.1 hypothetical protein ATP06_0205560 [Amycolatopsis regifaucium]SFJ34102.1 hypothetical protein SAMN04489731_11944 [Amycolatopsis regifaucium]